MIAGEPPTVFSGANMPSWAEKIADRYALHLTPDLVSWLDDGIWREPGGAEFSESLTPEELLEPESDLIWGGFLPPDMIPLIGNDYGDWLAARVDFDGQISEVVYWCHGGGDWLTYGDSLAEALIFDAYFHFRYGQRVHQLDPDRRDSQIYHLADWARGELGKRGLTIAPFWKDPDQITAQDALSHLDDSGICKVAIARERVLDALSHPLRTHADPSMAAKLAWPWNPDFLRGLFDTELLSAGQRSDLTAIVESLSPSLEGQSWSVAENTCLDIGAKSPKIGWAWDIAGWSAERRGDRNAAIDRYQRGLTCSVFSSDSVSFYSHWYADGAGKFAAARLIEMGAEIEGPMADYLGNMRGHDERAMRRSVYEFWFASAESAARNGDARGCYTDHYRSGWDVGLVELTTYSEILERLEQAAQRAQSESLARLAALHRKSF
jgi:hypothetical protein